ncbi:MAG: prepilin-type N-terminal cleavage/methylation domain-containing protein [Candidatus Aminicenantes bacterium]|nr:prepilin-type N-terminal cleavage/methylation domain-containing protein [Candidatus Aminicenantes bacterium]
MKKTQGFSIVEMLISTTLILVVMYSVFMLLEFHGELSKTQQARTRLQQESRFLLTNFASDLKNAGAILTLVHTGGFLAQAPFFNGVYPINGNFSGVDQYPDGIIIASGDPYAVTKLAAPAVPSGGSSLQVDSTQVEYPADPWAQGDKGILVGADGYYVFEVQSVTANSIAMRSAPVYYSGLLNSPQTPQNTDTGYVDTVTTAGNSVTYPNKAPVIRLTDFGIYLVNERFNSKTKRTMRELIKVTDSNGAGGNFLAESNQAEKGVIAENIWDFQVSYVCYPNYPDHTVKNSYFSPDSTGGTFTDLMDEINTRALKEIVINVVALSDEYAGKGYFDKLNVPTIGDRASYTLPAGKYTYQLFTLNIAPRNYNISI